MWMRTPWLNKSRHWSSPLIKVPFKSLQVENHGIQRFDERGNIKWLKRPTGGRGASQSLWLEPAFQSCCFQWNLFPLGHFFGVYLLRKYGFELQCLLMVIGKITKSILQELSSLFRLISYISSSFDYPDKPLGVKRICWRQSPSLLAMHPPQWWASWKKQHWKWVDALGYVSLSFFVGLGGDLGLDWSLGLSGTYLKFKKNGVETTNVCEWWRMGRASGQNPGKHSRFIRRRGVLWTDCLCS